MELDDEKKFILYAILTGLLLILLACILQLCLVPGAECRIPFLDDEPGPTYIYNSPPTLRIDTDIDYQAVLYTNKGNIKIDLYEESTPVTTNNFVFLTNEGFYDGVLFHMVKEDLVIQTGSRLSLDEDPNNDGEGGPGYTFNDEVNWDSLDLPQSQRDALTNQGFDSTPGLVSRLPKKYSVLMANSGEGNTNGSQFFIITADASDTRIRSLVGKHTVFGEVISGFDVVEAIDSVEVDDPNLVDPRPEDEIILEFVEILEVENGVVRVGGNNSERTSDNQNVTFE